MKNSQYVGILLLCGYFLFCGFTPAQWHFIDNVNLIFHEAGHTIFSFFGEFIHVLAGSAFQVLLPLSIALYFFFSKQFVSGAVVLAWAGQSVVNVSVYAADALKLELPLLGGDSVMHDWNYLLSQTGLLLSAQTIGNILYGIGMTIIVSSALLALYFTYKQQEKISK